MNTSFNVLDKTSNLQKQANAIIKFQYEGKEYLIYSIDENEQNKQIFVSKFILNSEGKSFIEDISQEEKSKLNNIVYNIVILMPSEYKQGKDAKTIIDNFTTKYSVILNNESVNLQDQEYYSNCSIAITNNELVNNAIKFYSDNLESKVTSENDIIPMWGVPDANTEMSKPIMPTPDNKVQEAESTEKKNEPFVQASIIPNNIPNNLPNNAPVIPASNIDENKTPTPVTESISATNEPTPIINTNPLEVSAGIPPVSEPELNNQPNPQAEKLAVVSDPSVNAAVGINPVVQPNLGRQKKAGFARSKYVVIGTICMVLAVVVVVVAYFLIKNIK